MSVLVIQNYPDSGLGQIGPILLEAGHSIDLRHAYQGDALPQDDSDHQALILLGGEQNALADAEFPYFPDLLNLIRAFGDKDKAVLGICLGSQLVARAYGAENILDRPMEFGWHEVRLTERGQSDPVLAAAGSVFPIFHWHRDTFSLPEGAVHMASSDMTAHQAYRIGRAVYGTQFHFEADTALVVDWNETLSDVIAEFDPEWLAEFPAHLQRSGAAADKAGAALARAWTSLI
ncbi:type 1 glutamine amidotransferase [Brucella pituitosa]|uniref:type 1 glutamine amidotransferase n=1 Tax=Brucella pituitosa TaxID=571256 RepID=UPI0001C875B4|nr:type 1 glutamine amidotransferase [Brucella pituitosa]PQZ48406.1 GMP synthase [Ochrobactrum sp. MYb19]PRA51647.1 GMP synthase [Ochrobactrum sp. MYb68]PRA64589.1 GMP synthase [Ochrobactrum sp. MYb18]PRA74899.1 GMP synthase [Brucella thiophenivorans]PRA83829.1 GMP synthase [Ochrobactrum sp. MYb29]PRA89888.1 GMP synthase [Ochrobactrum sp. MYb14]PRA96921.1 GMP synthase [Ochrobactrum sp. MYb15]